MTQDPAVVTWMIALAPRPRPAATGRHWWRELVTEAWRAAHDAREHLRESGLDVGGAHGAVVSAYQLEREEFDRLYPAPRLQDFMVHLSRGGLAPERLEVTR